MARTFSQLKSLVNSKLGQAAGTLTESDFLAGLNLALDDIRLKVDFPETEKTASLSPALFQDVTWYTVPSDMYGDDVIDLRPLVQLPYSPRDQNWNRNTATEFTRNQLDVRVKPKYSIEYNNGVRQLRILANPNSTAKNYLLNNCDTYNGNGTWTADTTNSDANSVSTDTVNYFEGSGATKFNVTVAQSVNNRATVYNPDMAVVDISGLTNAYIFFWVYIPDVTNVTNVQIVYGSDASSTPATKANYYTFTATTQFDGTALVTGGNFIGLARSAATQTGTVDNTAVRYLEVVLNYGVAQTNMTGVSIDGIYFRDGELYEIRYRTQNIVQAAGGGTKKQYFTLDDDVLLLNAEGETVFVQYAAGYLAPNVKDLATGMPLLQMANQIITEYKERHPSLRRVAQRNWYFD